MSKFQKVEYFEPGDICCSKCGYEPSDGWDMDPEGFFLDADQYWYCEECIEED